VRGVRSGSRGMGGGGRPREQSPESTAAAHLVRGELAFLLFTAVCVSLHPGFVLKRDEGGMSNYGLHIRTAIPYTLALALLATSSRRAAPLITSGGARTRPLRILLNSFSTMLVLILVSSYVYSLSVVLKDVHLVLGAILIALVGTASMWMFLLCSPSPLDWSLLISQLVGDAVALATATGALHLLFLSEIVTNVSFVCLLVRTTRRVTDDARFEFAPREADT
jgi:hypothetical protein